MKIKIKLLKPGVKIPSYAHPGDVGLDLYVLEDRTIPAGRVINTELGFALEFPEGYVARVADKSSLGLQGIHVFGGVYDAGYRGEYNVILYNSTSRVFKIEKGDKIAQLIVQPVEKVDIITVKKLSSSSRGEGRFGSTGKK